MAKIIPFPGSSPAPWEGDSHPTPETSLKDRFPGLFLLDVGLTVEQIEALISRSPERIGRLLTVDPHLEPEEHRSIPILKQTLGLLRAIAVEEPVKATPKGNLPTRIVKALFSATLADVEPSYVRVNKEDDSQALAYTRRLAQKAGLLSVRNKAFRLTRAAHNALDQDDVQEIYRRLLDAHLSAPQILDRYDRMDDGGFVSAAVPLLLHASRDRSGELFFEEDFAELVAVVFPEYRFDPELLAYLVRIRFFDRFAVPFGLFETGKPFEPPVNTSGRMWDSFGRWRRTSLLERVTTWQVEPPPRAVTPPEAAAATIMHDIHGAQLDLDGTADSRLERLCLRAIERNPADADAYVVWARLYRHQPELALQIADVGLQATGDQQPEVPEGVSPWADHLYRDVMRLHLARATALGDLKRIDEASAAFEVLLNLDPDDAMHARTYFIPMLIIADRPDEAERVLPRRPTETTDLWNEVLVAFARGGASAAKDRVAAAREANDFVPDMLLAYSLPRIPDYVEQGSIEEAVAYVDAAGPAWSHVKGTRAWLRKI